MSLLRPLLVVLLALSGASPRGAAAQGGLRTIGPGAAQMTAKQGGSCKAFAPADWMVVGNRPQNDAVDLTSGDRRMYAGWGIRGVNRGMQRYYGALYGDPETSSRFMVSTVGQSMGDQGPFSYTGAPQDIGDGFVVRQLESSGHRALIVYRTYPAPMGFPSGSYIVSLRIAMVPRNASPRELNLAVGVAASINCATTFVPPKTGDVPLPRPGDAFDRKRRTESDNLDYNVQLGTQWAHTPSGDLYYLDRATMWNETGPDGPGYYRKNGNDITKLIPGVP